MDEIRVLWCSLQLVNPIVYFPPFILFVKDTPFLGAFRWLTDIPHPRKIIIGLSSVNHHLSNYTPIFHDKKNETS